jgi:hypothetical protein
MRNAKSKCGKGGLTSDVAELFVNDGTEFSFGDTICRTYIN